MKKLLIVIAAGCIMYSCGNKEKKGTDTSKNETNIDSTLVTDSSWGAITATTNVDKLKEIFGEANIMDERICGPECVDSIDVTKVYRETSKEFIVYWDDSAYHKTINMIETYADNAPYHTATGLKIGSTMQDIVNENGKPINFLGFGWDYGGYISNYNGGKLDSSNVKFRLDLTGDTEDTSLLGDAEFNTDMPNAKKSLDKMKVYQLYLNLNQ